MTCVTRAVAEVRDVLRYHVGCRVVIAVAATALHLDVPENGRRPLRRRPNRGSVAALRVTAQEAGRRATAGERSVALRVCVSVTRRGMQPRRDNAVASSGRRLTAKRARLSGAALNVWHNEDEVR